MQLPHVLIGDIASEAICGKPMQEWRTLHLLQWQYVVGFDVMFRRSDCRCTWASRQFMFKYAYSIKLQLLTSCHPSADCPLVQVKMQAAQTFAQPSAPLPLRSIKCWAIAVMILWWRKQALAVQRHLPSGPRYMATSNLLLQQQGTTLAFLTII